MNKTNRKNLLGFLGIAVGVVLLTGCTQNFCSNTDKASIAYAYDSGVTVYVDNVEEIPDEYKISGKEQYWTVEIGGAPSSILAYIPVSTELASTNITSRIDTRYTAKRASFLNDVIIGNSIANGYSTPSYDYFKTIDQLVLDAAVAEANKGFQDANHYNSTNLTAAMINPFNKADVNGTEEGVEINKDSILLNYGYVKFGAPKVEGENMKIWSQWDKWNEELESTMTPDDLPSADFKAFYKQQIDTILNSQRSCISTQDGYFGHFGNDSSWSSPIEKKTWGYAWKKGFFEGLIVFPVSYLIDSIAYGIDPTLSGLGQVLSILIVTVVVRIVILALTFKSTLDQQRTQAIQPQLAKIQAKYPNSNTDKDQAQRMQQEQMALYKRNKINPMSMLITLIVQFPVFICVWGAMQGSSALASGSFLNLRLSDTISSVLTNFGGAWYTNVTGWWTAAVLFLMMAGFQILAMMLPRWLAKKKTKGIPKTTANPAQDQQGSTMKMMSWVMVIFTIVMGFALPSAMGLYWAVGALISMAQTLIMQGLMAKNKRK
ncbi:MAG: membrane protein insertase YidC [Bacilli bacterium]|nr:membrane protein insertase YidC [Bacilli bacterium]